MPWQTPLDQLTAAYNRLQRTVKYLIWWSVGFGLVMTLLAAIAISLSAFLAYARVADNEADNKRNEQTIVALCREINANNSDLLIVLLDQGIDIHRGQFLFPRDCNPAKLRKRFGVSE